MGKMKKRLAKKRYKYAISRIANKIPAAFEDKHDRRRWISWVTNAWMRDHREERA